MKPGSNRIEFVKQTDHIKNPLVKQTDQSQSKKTPQSKYWIQTDRKRRSILGREFKIKVTHMVKQTDHSQITLVKQTDHNRSN